LSSRSQSLSTFVAVAGKLKRFTRIKIRAGICKHKIARSVEYIERAQCSWQTGGVQSQKADNIMGQLLLPVLWSAGGNCSRRRLHTHSAAAADCLHVYGVQKACRLATGSAEEREIDFQPASSPGSQVAWLMARAWLNCRSRANCFFCVLDRRKIYWLRALTEVRRASPLSALQTFGIEQAW
jgi:hypothetical protein